MRLICVELERLNARLIEFDSVPRERALAEFQQIQAASCNLRERVERFGIQFGSA
jgi:Ni,Fe-hydrogenase III large subunit